jgi:hypothetical protein
MNQSESLSNLATALAMVQGQLRPAEENAENPFFKSKYADIASIISAVRDLMAKNGLSVSQFPGLTVNHSATLTTILMHNSGEWLSQDMTIPLAKVDPQGYGSAITYARRYALASVLGIVAGEDDDGNSATGKQDKGPKWSDDEEPTLGTNSQGPDEAEKVKAENGKKVMSAVKFVEYLTAKLGFNDDQHTRATVKLLTSSPAVPNDPDKRKRLFEALQAYRHLRDDKKLSRDDALAALADEEVV